MPIYTVTYKNNPQGLPFISQHWTVQADSEQKAIDKVAASFYEPLREQLKEELIAVLDAPQEPAQGVIVECVRCREAVTLATTVYAAPYFYKLQAEGTNVTSNAERLCVFCKEIMQAAPAVEAPTEPVDYLEKTLYTCATCGAQHVFSADDLAWQHEKEPFAPCGCAWKAYFNKPQARATYMLTYESVSANGKGTKLSFHDITHHYLTPWYGDIHGGKIERMSFDASTQKAIVFVSFDYALEQRVLESVTQIAGATPNILEYN